MKRGWIIKSVFSLHLSIAVMLWTMFVLGGYAFDHVSHYGGETPMALDTATCLFLLSVACAILSLRYMSWRGGSGDGGRRSGDGLPH